MAQPLNFYLLTDLHHFASCFERDPEKLRGDQKCMAETGAIIDAAFEQLLADKDVDIVLVDGDISNNGEHQSHEEVIEKLYRLKNGGKRVFAITATHDYNNAWLNNFGKNADPSAPRPTDREELLTLYHDFGLNEALSVDADSHCYSVRPAEGYRLLCLNDDGNGRSFCGYYNKTLDWIRAQVEEAHAEGEYVFAMTHHPVLPPTPIYPAFSARDMLGYYEKTTTFLADLGVEFIFTGHTHMQNIAVKKTDSDNHLFDINTASLVGFPPCMRKCRLTDTAMEVRTIELMDFDWDRKGKTVREYMQYQFDWLLVNLFDAAAFDIDKLAGMAGGFSIERETIYKYQKLITPLGKLLQKLTLGDLARLLLIHCPASVKPIKLKDFIMEAIRNIWFGNEPYVPGTPVAVFFDGLTKRLGCLTKPFDKSGSIRAVLDIVPAIIGDTGYDDWNADLPRRR